MQFHCTVYNIWLASKNGQPYCVLYSLGWKEGCVHWILHQIHHQVHLKALTVLLSPLRKWLPNTNYFHTMSTYTNLIKIGSVKTYTTMQLAHSIYGKWVLLHLKATQCTLLCVVYHCWYENLHYHNGHSMTLRLVHNLWVTYIEKED